MGRKNNSIKVKSANGRNASGINKDYIASFATADEFVKAIQAKPHIYASFNNKPENVKAVYEQAKGVEPSKELKPKEPKETK